MRIQNNKLYKNTKMNMFSIKGYIVYKLSQLNNILVGMMPGINYWKVNNL